MSTRPANGQCVYLSGPAVDGTNDKDRCPKRGDTLVSFTGDRSYSYCLEHAPHALVLPLSYFRPVPERRNP